MMKAEFVMHQYYTASIDESKIDTHRREWKTDPKYIEEHFIRLHRMFQAIVAEKKALSHVLEYQVLREHEALTEGNRVYIEEHYGKELSFPAILLSIADCFTQEDRQWLENIARQHEQFEQAQSHAEDERDPYILHDLEDSFKVEASGWNLHARS